MDARADGLLSNLFTFRRLGDYTRTPKGPMRGTPRSYTSVARPDGSCGAVVSRARDAVMLWDGRSSNLKQSALLTRTTKSGIVRLRAVPRRQQGCDRANWGGCEEVRSRACGCTIMTDYQRVRVGVHVGSRVSLGSLRQPLVRELFSRPVVGQTSRCVRVVVA